jgi:hypothetical protein
MPVFNQLYANELPAYRAVLMSLKRRQRIFVVVVTRRRRRRRGKNEREDEV